MFNKKLVFALVVALVVLYLLNFRLTNDKKQVPSSDNWTVYGTMGCGWTRKQLKHMKDNNIPHKFIDCDKEDCGDFNAYPTLKDANGNVTEGFTLVQ